MLTTAFGWVVIGTLALTAPVELYEAWKRPCGQSTAEWYRQDDGRDNWTEDTCDCDACEGGRALVEAYLKRHGRRRLVKKLHP